MLLRINWGSELTSDWLFNIRLVNPITVTATRVPTEKLQRQAAGIVVIVIGF